MGVWSFLFLGCRSPTLLLLIMERLRTSIEKVNEEFNKILANVQNNVSTTAESSYQESKKSLDATTSETGLHTRAEQMKRRLQEAIAHSTQFSQQVDQLEQVYLISEDLKNAVRELEKTYK